MAGLNLWFVLFWMLFIHSMRVVEEKNHWKIRDRLWRTVIIGLRREAPTLLVQPIATMRTRIDSKLNEIETFLLLFFSSSLLLPAARRSQTPFLCERTKSFLNLVMYLNCYVFASGNQCQRFLFSFFHIDFFFFFSFHAVWLYSRLTLMLLWTYHIKMNRFRFVQMWTLSRAKKEKENQTKFKSWALKRMDYCSLRAHKNTTKKLENNRRTSNWLILKRQFSFRHATQRKKKETTKSEMVDNRIDNSRTRTTKQSRKCILVFLLPMSTRETSRKQWFLWIIFHSLHFHFNTNIKVNKRFACVCVYERLPVHAFLCLSHSFAFRRLSMKPIHDYHLQIAIILCIVDYANNFEIEQRFNRKYDTSNPFLWLSLNYYYFIVISAGWNVTNIVGKNPLGFQLKTKRNKIEKNNGTESKKKNVK